MCQSSPHLIHPCISKTQKKNTAIYKLMHYLWSKVSREDSSAQRGRPSGGCVKLCESGSRSGTQNLVEGLFLWAPTASAHGLFSFLCSSPFSHPLTANISWAERNVTHLKYCHACAQPRVSSLPDTHGKEDEAPAIAENCACMGNSPWGKSNCFQLLLGNSPLQCSINTYQIWSLLPTVLMQ